MDIPSGVVGDSGKISSSAIKADYTLAIGLPKLGHIMGSGSEVCGKIKIIDVGLPKLLLEEGDISLLTRSSISSILSKRSDFAHKNTFGHALVLGGSHGLCGALSLSSEAALKSGCGLVSAATWEVNYLEFLSRLSSNEVLSLIHI